MTIKLVVSGRDVAECLELEIDEDVMRVLINTVQYRQASRAKLESSDSEVSYWLETGRNTLQHILSHQINSRNELDETMMRESEAYSGEYPQQTS